MLRTFRARKTGTRNINIILRSKTVIVASYSDGFNPVRSYGYFQRKHYFTRPSAARTFFPNPLFYRLENCFP